MDNQDQQMFEFVVDEEELHASPKSGKRRRSHGKKKHRSRFAKWWSNRKRWQKALLITGTSLVLVVALALGVFFTVFRYHYKRITTNPEELGFSEIIDKNIVNIALFGIDSRNMNSFKGLSDSIMILSLNTQTKKIKIISVMRDSLVPIEKDGKTRYTKINAAYSLGGPELAIKTLNKVFGLDISEYGTVNFLGMADIIDAVGGIDVTLADGELDAYGYKNGKKVNYGFNGLLEQLCKYFHRDPSGLYIHQGGTYHLNGVQAVAYARIRHAANIEGVNNDYGRTDRQRYVMEQLFNKALTVNKSQYAALAKAMIPCCETSLSYSEIMSLAFNILLNHPAYEQTRVPLTEYQMNNRTYVYYDLDYAGKLIRAFIYDDISPEKYMEINGVEKNDWYRGSSGSYSGNSGTSGKTSSGSQGSSGVQSVDETASSKEPVSDGPDTSQPTESDEPDSSGPQTDQPDPAESTDPGTGDDGTQTTPDPGGTGDDHPENPSPAPGGSGEPSSDTATANP